MRCVTALLVAMLACGEPALAQREDTPPGSRLRRENPLREFQAGADALFVNDFEQAVWHLRRAQQGLPNDPEVSFALGYAYFGAGDFQAARTPLEFALQSGNAPASVHLWLGATYVALGEFELAIGQRRALAQLLADCQCEEAEEDRMRVALNDLTRTIDERVPEDVRAELEARVEGSLAAGENPEEPS